MKLSAAVASTANKHYHSFFRLSLDCKIKVSEAMVVGDQEAGLVWPVGHHKVIQSHRAVCARNLRSKPRCAQTDPHWTDLKAKTWQITHMHIALAAVTHLVIGSDRPSTAGSPLHQGHLLLPHRPIKQQQQQHKQV